MLIGDMNRTIRRFTAKILCAVFAVALACMPLAGQAVLAAPPSGFQSTPIITSGLEGPSGFEIAPDGRIFILERTGKIKIYKNGQLLPTPFADLPSVAAGDRGMIGIEFDPDFDVNCYVYFYYTSASDLLNRLVRFNACGDVGTDGPFTIYQTNSPSQELHVGGSIRFGADGKMYFAVGDNGYPPNGQDLSNPHGKILRINRDGSVPADNPFYGQPGKLGEIWAYGFRNPWRFQFDSATGRMYGSDVGDFSWEEINHIAKGGNYGWPLKEGYCAPNCEGTIPPIYAYPHDGESAAATGGPVYRSTMFPAEYQGDLFFGDYAKGFVKHMELGPNGENLGVQDFDTNAGSVVDMKVAPDGSMYYLTYWPGRLYRVTYDTGNSVPVANATADVTKGLDPLTVNFSSAGSSDPDGTPLTYNWNFGDGTSSTAANPTKTYMVKGTYVVELTVSDGQNFAQAVPITIQVGQPPTVRISVPADGSTYQAGDTITYNAFGNDAAGLDINDAGLSTDIIMHHATHTHPFMDNLIGRANSFTIPDHGEAAADTWYEITTTATDTNGLKATATVNIHPEVVNVTYRSDVPGIGVNVDGVPYPNPYTTTGVIGFKRELSAAPIKQGGDGNWYQFRSWSDGGAIRHKVTTPATDAIFTADYEPAPAFRAEYFDNPDLAGAPKIVRNEPVINNNWEFGSPGADVPTENFSARYTKDQFFAAGRYKFTTATDDGVRLYIDGQRIIDVWYGQNQAHSATIDLEEGMHEIRMEYFEASGGAYARLNWDTTPDQPLPVQDGYTAGYFNNLTLAGTPALTRTDPAVDFDWGDGSPGPQIGPDNFSARWVRSEEFAGGDYEFTVTADDGVRVFIDGQLVLDRWIDQPATTYTFMRSIGAGSHDIKMEYYERGGGAVAKMSYRQVGQSGYGGKYWTVAAGGSPTVPARTPDLARTDPAIDFEWGNGGPGSPIGLDHYVAEWTRTALFDEGSYRFKVRSDDGIKVFVDGQLVLDRWFDQGGDAEYFVDKAMTAGPHDIKVQYYENAGGAIAKFNFEKLASASTGWAASYWNTPDAGTAPAIPTTPPTLTRTDPTINFNWGGGSPASVINLDHFVARWTKTETLAAGTYRFTTNSDDGIRVYVDDQLVIDQWNDHAPTLHTGDITLAAGDHQLRVEFYENAGGAVAELEYTRAGP